MKVVNPHYVSVSDANAAHVKRNAAVLAYLAAEPDRETVTFDELRAALGLSRAQLPDGAIAQICKVAAIKVAE